MSFDPVVPRNQCTKLSVHRTRPDHLSAHLDRPINLQIKPITAEGSVHPRSNGSQPSAAPVYHARIHTITKSRGLFLLSPTILSLSSDLPFPAMWSLWTTTERLLASCKAKPKPFSTFSPPPLAGNGRDFCRPPKLQTGNSPSSDINDRQNHHHQNSLP